MVRVTRGAPSCTSKKGEAEALGGACEFKVIKIRKLRKYTSEPGPKGPKGRRWLDDVETEVIVYRIRIIKKGDITTKEKPHKKDEHYKGIYLHTFHFHCDGKKHAFKQQTNA